MGALCSGVLRDEEFWDGERSVSEFCFEGVSCARTKAGHTSAAIIAKEKERFFTGSPASANLPARPPAGSRLRPLFPAPGQNTASCHPER